MKNPIIKSSCSVAAIIVTVMTLHSHEIRISEEGLTLIGRAEDCRSIPYYCPANVLTVGIGSTTGTINPNKKYTELEIAKRWVADIKEAEICVNHYAAGEFLPQNVFDAMVSITFNVGCTGMRNSTMFKYAKAGDLTAVCQEFPRWVYAGKQKLQGLVLRREAERNLCLRGL